MKRLLTILCMPVLLLLGAAEASGADLQKATEAYDTGDYAAALREWRPLAEQGDAKTQFNLALMYDLGKGMAEDDAQAAAWYRKVAKQGDVRAQFNLGFMYRKGQGVAQDYAQAHMWYNLAAAQGDEDAAKWRDKVAEKMTSGQVATAQRLATEWMEKHRK
jgi:TPR repeat protein